MSVKVRDLHLSDDLKKVVSDVVKVDGVAADAEGNVPLGAVRYNQSQTLTEAQKLQARQNIGAVRAYRNASGTLCFEF